jgi:hypothetical protein
LPFVNALALPLMPAAQRDRGQVVFLIGAVVGSINMMRKDQVKRLAGSDAQGQAKFVDSLFQIAA